MVERVYIDYFREYVIGDNSKLGIAVKHASQADRRSILIGRNAQVRETHTCALCITDGLVINFVQSLMQLKCGRSCGRQRGRRKLKTFVKIMASPAESTKWAHPPVPAYFMTRAKFGTSGFATPFELSMWAECDIGKPCLTPRAVCLQGACRARNGLFAEHNVLLPFEDI